jgi:hypothetical protein
MARDAALIPPAFAPVVAARVGSPPAVRLLLGLCAVGFFIYMPVALFRTTAPLLLLDLALGFALLFTIGSRVPHRLLGGSAAVSMLVLVYVLSVIPALFIDRPDSTVSSVQGLRSALFGVVALVTASAWLDTTRRADQFLRVLAIGGVIAAAYAVKQVAFGLLPFEAERVALMGASAREVDVLDRVRIPSLFGDPATFGFFGMLSICLLLVARRRSVLPVGLRTFPRLSVLLILVGVGSTLTRAPMLGLAVAMAWRLVTSDRFTPRFVAKLVAVALVALLLVFALDWLVTNNVLADSPIGWVRAVHNTLTAVWTLVPSAFGGDSTAQLDALRSGSASQRSDAWVEGLEFLVRNPLGGGLGTMTEGGANVITFSPVDVGFLRYGLELGWVGMFSMMALWAAVFAQGFRKWRRATDSRTRELGRGLLGAWLAIGVAQSVTSFLHTELIAAVAWMVGAQLLNLDRIANSETRRVAMQPDGVKT